MKKILILSLLISVSFNLYLVNVEYVVKDDFESDYAPINEPLERVDEVKLAQSSVLKKQILKPKKSCKCSESLRAAKEEMSDNLEGQITEAQKYSEQYIQEQVEKKLAQWVEDSDKFFYDELGLSSEQIARYRELARSRQKEIDAYFSKKHKASDKGEEVAYLYTSDDTIFMGKITEVYEEALKEVFGADNLSRYKNFVNEHNSLLNKDEFIPFIEF